MCSYETLNRTFGFQTGQKMTLDNFWVPFLVGGTSKSIASILLTPVNIVRLRLQMRQYSTEQVDKMGLKAESNKQQAQKYSGMLDVVRKIYRNEGILAFYKGLTPNLVKTFPSAGMFFISYELTLTFLEKMTGKD